MTSVRQVLSIILATLFISTPFCIQSVVGDVNQQFKGPLQTYEPHFPIFIVDESDFRFYGFIGEGTQESPFILSNVNITSGGWCISISDTESYFEIRDSCFFGSGDAVIVLSHTAYGIISNCWIENGWNTIRMEHCYDISVINNFVVGATQTGIELRQSYNVSISGNLIFGNDRGIEISSSDNSNVINNKIYTNNLNGIESSAYTYNSIYGNEIGWNVGSLILTGEKNAEDNGESNTWDNGLDIGNDWSDYDGIGPYEIDGDAASFDNFPALLVDNTAPLISLLNGDEIHVESIPAVFNWSVQDDHPFQYRIYVDGERVRSEFFMSGIITVQLAGLMVGNHNLTIVARDGAGNSDQVDTTVTIVAEIDQTPLLLSLVGLVLIIAVVASMELNRRRKIK